MGFGLATIASTAAVLDAVPDAIDLLTETERGRARRLRQDGDRQAFIAAHVLVRLCAANLFGLAQATPLVQRCPTCGGAHGPAHFPEYPQAGVSLAHADGVVAAAVATTPVGVDTEPLASARGLRRLSKDVASPGEAGTMADSPDAETALLRLWVRKEALVKLGVADLGAMSDLDLSELTVDLTASGQRRPAPQRPGEWGGYRIIDLRLDEPAAWGAVVSESDIEVVPLDRLARCRLPMGDT